MIKRMSKRMPMVGTLLESSYFVRLPRHLVDGHQRNSASIGVEFRHSSRYSWSSRNAISSRH